MDGNQLINTIKSYVVDALKNISAVDEEALSPIAALVGIKPQTLCTFLKLAPLFLDGEFDLRSLFPYVLPTLISYYLSLKTSDGEGAIKSDRENENAPSPPETGGEGDISVLKDISFGATDAFDVYLQSASASS